MSVSAVAPLSLPAASQLVPGRPPGWADAFGADALWGVVGPQQELRDGLDEGVGATDEGGGGGEIRSNLGDERCVDPPGSASPVPGWLPGEGEHRVVSELVGVDHVVG